MRRHFQVQLPWLVWVCRRLVRRDFTSLRALIGETHCQFLRWGGRLGTKLFPSVPSSLSVMGAGDRHVVVLERLVEPFSGSTSTAILPVPRLLSDTSAGSRKGSVTSGLLAESFPGMPFTIASPRKMPWVVSPLSPTSTNRTRNGPGSAWPRF